MIALLDVVPMPLGGIGIQEAVIIGLICCTTFGGPLLTVGLIWFLMRRKKSDGSPPAG